MRAALTDGVRLRRPGPTWLRSLRNQCRILFLNRRDAIYFARTERAGPTIRERQQELVRFYLRYEELVEILVDTVQVGATPVLEAKYRASREWMLVNYPAVCRNVIAYLKYNAEDAEQSLAMNGCSGDAFEALFTAPSLGQFRLHDDGQMISRISRTREALNLYGHHLRRLASNE